MANVSCLSPQQSLDMRFEAAVSSCSKTNPNLYGLRELLSEGAHIDGTQQDGLPLRHAITKVSMPLIHFLVAAGADVNARLITRVNDANSIQPHFNTETPLHWATYRASSRGQLDLETIQYAEMILTLMAAGADEKARTVNGLVPTAILSERTSLLIETALTLPIHAAIQINSPSLCMRLLDRQYNPDAKNRRKQTAWRLAELKSPECLAGMRSWQAMQAINGVIDGNRLSKLE